MNDLIAKVLGSEGIDISIPLRFNGPQPNAYGVDAALAKSHGDTRTGSSVNFDEYTFTPHCNGTHTECVGHITHERISVRDCLKDVIVPAVLVSIKPINTEDAREIGSAIVDGRDKLITRDLLSEKLASIQSENPRSEIRDPQSKAMIVRTLPNDDRKLTAVYGGDNIPPYFTAVAMKLIVDSGFTHLLCDLPSIDRISDEGKLINHRIFWNVEDGSFEANPHTRVNSTITELIYVPNEVPDGEYLLNLQIAAFDTDCAPSRPVLFTT